MNVAEWPTRGKSMPQTLTNYLVILSDGLKSVVIFMAWARRSGFPEVA